MSTKECCGIKMSIMGTAGKNCGDIVQCMRCGYRTHEKNELMISSPLKDYIDKNIILQEYINNKIEVGDRWTKGINHHPKSEELMKHLIELDFAFNNDYFSFKMGGDGDSGETLMYLMDMFFELQDQKFLTGAFPIQKDMEFITDILNRNKK